MSESAVIHEPQANRFYLEKAGHQAVLHYRMEGPNIRFVYAGVPKELGGQGIGKTLVSTGLEFAKAQQLGIIPQCSFVRAYMEKRPEWHDLWIRQ